MGALGIAINPAHVAVAEVDRFGDPVRVGRMAGAIQGRRQPQVKAALGEVAANVVAEAKAAARPVVVARLLTGFAYNRWQQRLFSGPRGRAGHRDQPGPPT